MLSKPAVEIFDSQIMISSDDCRENIPRKRYGRQAKAFFGEELPYEWTARVLNLAGRAPNIQCAKSQDTMKLTTSDKRRDGKG